MLSFSLGMLIFICLFNSKYLLSASCVPRALVGAGNTAVNKQSLNLFRGDRQSINKVNTVDHMVISSLKKNTFRRKRGMF